MFAQYFSQLLTALIFCLVAKPELFVQSYGEPKAAALVNKFHIPDQKVFYGTLFQFKLPLTAFHSPNIKSVDVHVVPKTPLPTWLKFDPLTRELLGLPGSKDIGEVQIRVIATYLDREALSSHIFRIKVLNIEPVNLAIPLTSYNVSRGGFDRKCVGIYPTLMTVLFSIHYKFLNLQEKIKFFLTAKNDLQLSSDDLKIGTAHDFYRTPDCQKPNSPVIQSKKADQLALRIVIKMCSGVCKYADEVYEKTRKIEFGGPEPMHWITYSLDKPQKLPTYENSNSKEEVKNIPMTTNFNKIITDPNAPEIKHTINWDFMFEEKITLKVGQIMVIPISPYLVQNEKAYMLSTAESHFANTVNAKKERERSQWIQLINNSTDLGESRITIIGLESKIGDHTFCLEPSLLQDECIKFVITVQNQPADLQLNQAISINFDFPPKSFEQSTEVKLNVIRCILSTAYPSLMKQRTNSILLNDFYPAIDSSLRINVSLSDYHASLCSVKDEISNLYTNFANNGNSNEPSQFFREKCDGFDPKRVEIQYFGPCSGINVAEVELSNQQNSASSDVIKISVSTVLLISIISFIILVVVGVSIVFLIMHFTVRKPESIYCADSFCEMRAKNMPTIFPHEVQDHNSSRSSSPSRLYSLVHQSSTKSSLAQPTIIQPTRVITSSRSPDMFQSRNSFGSNRSDPNYIMQQQPLVFDSITEVVKTSPTASYASTVLANPNSPILITTGTPDVLLNSGQMPQQHEIYDVPIVDSVLRFGSFRKPRIESNSSYGGTKGTPLSNSSPYPIQRGNHSDYQDSEEQQPTASILAPKVRLSSDNSEDKQFLQFRMPSPLPTQALLLQAQADLDKHKLMSHRFC